MEGDMFKGWQVALIAVILILGSTLLIKSTNAVCGREFMRIGLCRYIPDVNSLSYWYSDDCIHLDVHRWNPL